MHEANDTSYWDRLRGFIRTGKGGWVIGEAIYNHGFSMMEDLVGKASFFQVLVLNATGRLPERRLADWLEAYFICLSWPDARIWCNQIGSLAGTLGVTPVAAVTAGILAADSRMYGPGTAVSATDFIVEALAKKQGGMTASGIVEEHRERFGSPPKIAGFARPVARGDERIFAMERVTTVLQFPRGEHINLAYEIEEVLANKYDERMNIAGYRSAFLSDHGFTSQEVYRILSTAVHSGVIACYAEAADQPRESFFPLHCDDIDYRGSAPRPLPRRSPRTAHE